MINLVHGGGVAEAATPPRAGRARFLPAELGTAHQLGVQYTLVVGLGVLEAGEPRREEYVGDAIRWLVMHEVGHILSLRHNFKGSSGIPYGRLQDTRFTRAAAQCSCRPRTRSALLH